MDSADLKEIRKMKAMIRALLVSKREKMALWELEKEWDHLGQNASKFSSLMAKYQWKGFRGRDKEY